MRAASGGADYRLVERARALVDERPTVACHLVDWAWFADPSDTRVGEAVIEIYGRRIVDAARNTQEVLMYLDHLTDVQLALNHASG